MHDQNEPSHISFWEIKKNNKFKQGSLYIENSY